MLWKETISSSRDEKKNESHKSQFTDGNFNRTFSSFLFFFFIVFFVVYFSAFKRDFLYIFYFVKISFFRFLFSSRLRQLSRVGVIFASIFTIHNNYISSKLSTLLFMRVKQPWKMAKCAEKSDNFFSQKLIWCLKLVVKKNFAIASMSCEN